MKTPTEAQRIFLNGKLDSEKLSEAQKRALRKKLNTRELTEAQRTENIEKLFELNLETHLLVEIKDIQDELNIVSSILGQQKDVLRRLYKLCFVNEGAEGDSSSSRELKATRDSSVESSADIQEDSGDKPKHKGILHHDDESDASSIHERKKEKQVHVHWEDAKTKEKDTPLLKKRGLVEDNFAIVMSNIRIIEDMQHYAETVHTSVISNLLDLKQRQANAWEARFSREGSQQSQRQGNIMLVFTLVTIVFLPLSFMSSFFALGVNSFPKDAQSGNVSWPLHTLALLLFGISTLVFVPLVFIALYVNQITSFTRETFQAFFLPSNPVIDDIEEKKVEEDDESDEEEFKDDGDESTKVAEDDEGHGEIISEVLSEDTTETYARLFGRWNFHTKIPGVRELWRWQVYLNNADDHDSEYLDDEYENYNYPLQHFLDKIPFEKVVPTFIHRWRSPRDDDISSYYYTDSDDDSNATRDRRRSRRVSTIVVEEVRRRRGSDDEEVVVIEEYSPGPRNRVRRRGARPVPRITRLFARRKEKAGSDDEDEEVEDGSDLPQSRASRLLGAVDLVARMFGRRIVDDDDDSAITYDDSDDSRPRRPPIPRAPGPVVSVTRRPHRRRSNSDDEIVVIEERSPVRRAGRLVGRSNRRPGRRRSDSDDEVVVIEERRPPSSRVRRAGRPAGRTARMSGRRNLDSDDEVVVVEEDESDIPQSRAGRVFRSVAWMFGGRARETEDEYSDETASYDEEEDELPRSLASRVLAPVEWFFRRRGRETEEEGEYSDETRSSDHGEVAEVEEEEEEEEEELPRSLASRVLGPVGRIFRRRGAETDEEGEYSDETRPSREEASATSGSDGPASAHRGLGAALPEPLKRLFLRRRRVHDVESVLEDD
ncbi:hypothetical protein L207DRAFT_128482 [Hyaloscypha variabilis F]|uniref:Cora-domain-containing protein n=1 Tax=Hyaloscypha variabilis (strain UAMH 11265 / GT02V1 / F) TaxID=1149755 RepID=A0A2J6R8P7_HYAVF|nr:hypothetical protein L207DRAFT_128482 [Hyaloscypha variabilis F]